MKKSDIINRTDTKVINLDENGKSLQFTHSSVNI